MRPLRPLADGQMLDSAPANLKAARTGSLFGMMHHAAP
jgi:hypothetical protein